MPELPIGSDPRKLGRSNRRRVDPDADVRRPLIVRNLLGGDFAGLVIASRLRPSIAAASFF